MRRFFIGDARIVVTGDSLSYNRYDYDPVPRVNAYDCFPDMGSWPFRIRDAAMTEGDFVYARSLTETRPAAAPNRIFGDRAVTFGGSADFVSEGILPRIVLHLQCLSDGGIFDVFYNGRQVLFGVSFRGNPSCWHGMEWFSVSFKADKGCRHEISFRGNGSGTLLGISDRCARVIPTGQGARRCDFFLDNFYDRIGRFCPSLLVFIIGANDEGSVGSDVFGRNLREVLRRTREVNTECGFILLTPTDQHNADKPDSDDSPFFSRASASLFNAEIKSAVREFGGIFVDTCALFGGKALSEWRFDNVHLTRQGSDMLFDHLMKL